MAEEADDGCSWYQWGCKASETVGDAIGDAISDFAESVWLGFEDVLIGLATMWVNVPAPTLTTSDSEGFMSAEAAPAGSNIETVLGYMQWIGFSVAVMSLIILGANMAMKSRTGEGVQVVGRMGLVLFAVVLLGAASGLIGTLGGGGALMTNVTGTAGWLQGQVYWFMLAAAIFGVIIGAIRMIWEQRAEPGKDVLKQLLTLVVVSALGATVISLLLGAADDFASQVIDNASDGDFAGAVMDMLFMVSVGATPGMAAILVIVLGLTAILMSLVQMVLMVARSAMLILLVGLLPLTASFTNTESGKAWFRKACGWTIAFILYKPVAAIIYAAAINLVGSSGPQIFNPAPADQDAPDFLGMAAGFMMMLLALFALPALLRFVSPAMAAMGGAAAGGALAGTAAAALPTGAQALGRLSTDSSGGGDPGPSGSSGSSGSEGSQGASGSSGSAGSSGADGSSGESAASGAANASGASGGAGAGAGAGSAGAGGGAAASGASGGAAGGAAGGGAAAGGAAAGGAAGPVGLAAGAAMKAGSAVKQGAQNAADDSTSGGGDQPSGSK